MQTARTELENDIEKVEIPYTRDVSLHNPFQSTASVADFLALLIQTKTTSSRNVDSEVQPGDSSCAAVT